MGERLRAGGLTPAYDPSAAAERLGVSIPEGALTAIVGPHGSGKSTLLHALDLNQACRYATQVIALQNGRVVAQGPPADIVTADLVDDVFGVRCRIVSDPETDTPLVLPPGRTVRRRPMRPAALRPSTDASTEITDKPMDHAPDRRADAGSTRDTATGDPRARA
ncbi:ATP-binding cassette domain-containing protein [Streptomyces sp. NPDC005963]|uniref:ATP-binding cassette domain-containing protein n=1 Tax=Streptomyces sp. NPDC005963 TaxID=3156721 RepID=UPI0033E65F17